MKKYLLLPLSISLVLVFAVVFILHWITNKPVPWLIYIVSVAITIMCVIVINGIAWLLAKR